MSGQHSSGPKKRRGRPPGRNLGETLPLRLSHELLAAVERFAEAEEMSRSAVIRAAVTDYLVRKRALPKD